MVGVTVPARDDDVALGRLRFTVKIYRRDQVPDPNSTGILDKPAELATVRAEVVPVGGGMFYGTQQVDTGVTHRMLIRWLDWLDATHIVTRQTLRPDGSPRNETFRIRRTSELAGRNRFLMVDLELETRQ